MVTSKFNVGDLIIDSNQVHTIVKIEDEKIDVMLKKKRDLPLLLETMKKFENIKIPQYENRSIIFSGLSTS